jgi:hypothetical protein
MYMSTRKQEIRRMLLAMPEGERRELVHSLIDYYIGTASGCWTLVDLLDVSCGLEWARRYIARSMR